ncbi:hypothetical protein [Geosporobacter ferrireducens]|uniref:hypothetical protein n=1 Tax=Geosporobacter ferrireducens TaxID=1424294 RepID=UPI00139ADC96|nr:hypothetical protein [Geosporobacter ferrireducens]MTI56136.1 hypothetical protein [Geosporobacter ferrireducens]
MDKKQLEYAINVLTEYLSDGPKQYDITKKHCSDLGIKRSVLKQARQALNVKTINTGSTWLWYIYGDKNA